MDLGNSLKLRRLPGFNDEWLLVLGFLFFHEVLGLVVLHVLLVVIARARVWSLLGSRSTWQWSYSLALNLALMLNTLWFDGHRCVANHLGRL